jgi:hypothetical protein
MEDWTADLNAFVAGDNSYKYGTSEADDWKVITPDGTIVVEKDARWNELLVLGDVFSSM